MTRRSPPKTPHSRVESLLRMARQAGQDRPYVLLQVLSLRASSEGSQDQCRALVALLGIGLRREHPVAVDISPPSSNAHGNDQEIRPVAESLVYRRSAENSKAQRTRAPLIVHTRRLASVASSQLGLPP